MKPTISSTAAGSRITVYFPGGISRGCAESKAFLVATSANRTGSTFATSGEFVFCHPDESAASMVTETSAEVCTCQLLNPRELKIPSKDSPLEKTPAAVRECRSATVIIFLTPSARISGVIAAVCSKCREGTTYAESTCPFVPPSRCQPDSFLSGSVQRYE